MKWIIKTWFLLFCIVPIKAGWTQTLWHQTDWSGRQYQHVECFDGDIAPGELVLINNPSDMRPAVSPTKKQGIWDMEVFQDRLFMAACSDPVNENGGDVLAYNYADDQCRKEYTVYEQGLIQMRVHDDKLYIPGLDSRRKGWRWGNIYIFDGNAWQRKETVPHAIHVFDLIFYQDALYVTTGTELNQNSAIVYRSHDDGDTWQEVFRTQTLGRKFRRLFSMGVYDDVLYVQTDIKPPHGKVLLTYNGREWGRVAVDSLIYASPGLLETFDDRFCFLSLNSLYLFDGNRWQHTRLPFRGMWISRSLVSYQGHLYGGAEKGLLYKSKTGLEWQIADSTGNSHEEIESLAVYHGRLYAGVNNRKGQGRVYVSASEKSGWLISLPHESETPVQSAVLKWKALLPSKQTAIRFQLRSAELNEDLEKQDFAGPDGSGSSFYRESGTEIHASHTGCRWMQYKVFMSTNDALYMPVLQEVSLIVK